MENNKFVAVSLGYWGCSTRVEVGDRGARGRSGPRSCPRGSGTGASVFELPVPGVPWCRGPSVSRLACPCDVFSGGAGRGDRGSSGCLAPESRPVRPLCPGLRVLRAGCLRDRGSPGADIATFDPQSRNSPVMVVGLFCFMAVRWRSAGCSPADDPRSRPRTADGPQGTGPATGRQAPAPRIRSLSSSLPARRRVSVTSAPSSSRVYRSKSA
ncbi:MAG: hypothetical protein QOH87_4306 [Trebonia sp.]|nr:hypothetical protein [Trebonia sp.]